MGVKTYYDSDAGAPVLTGNAAGELLNLLTKCLVEGYGAKTSLGWQMLGPTAHKAAYRATAPGASGCWLHVNDAGPGAHGYREARARGYREIASLDGAGEPVSATTPFPTTAQLSAGVIWRRSNTADATARRWALYGDERFFQLWVDSGYGDNHYDGLLFGDVAEQGPVAVTLIAGRHLEAATGLVTTASQVGAIRGATPGTQNGHYASTAAGESVTAGKLGNTLYTPATGAAVIGFQGLTFPNPHDLRAFLAPIELYGDSAGVYGAVPGLYQPYHARPLVDRTPVEVIEGPLAGRTLVTQAVAGNTSSAETNTGRAWIDVTGPWR
ncbi:MAG: hypothetical protein AB1578_07070 [Thermodesulfobacteriota bacterium]